MNNQHTDVAIKTQRTHESFVKLDALRVLAAGLVLSSHLFWREGLEGIGWSTLKVVFGNGGLGVRLFFTLSGFLITFLLATERKTFGTISLRLFWIRRALRIWPLYFLVVAVGFLLPVLLEHLRLANLPRNERLLPFLFFFANFELIRLVESGAGASGILGVLWSISIEEQFYILWPVLAATISWRPFRRLALTALFAWALFLLWTAPVYPQASYGSLENVGFLLSGALLGLLKVNEQTTWQRATRLPLRLIIPIAACLVFVANLAASSSLLSGIADTIFCTSLTLWALQGSSGRFVTTIAKLAPYTYGLYMYHRVASTLVVGLLRRQPNLTDLQSHILGGTLSLALTAVLAAASYHYFEGPCLRLKERFARLHREAAP